MRKISSAVVSLLAASVLTSGKDYKVQIEGGSKTRPAVIITTVPSDFPEHGLLQGAGFGFPFQKSGADQLVFILPANSGGSSFKVISATGAPQQNIQAKLDDGKVALSTAGKNIFVYQGEKSPLPRPDIKQIFQRGGYIHPVWTPAGKLVTDDYSPNHLHHHGIWFPWTKTEFEGRSPDFWNMGEGKGTVEFVKFGQTWSGPVHGGFIAHHRFIDLTSGSPRPALEETWQVTAYHFPSASKPVWIFDLVSTQSCSSASALKLPQYFYGGLGFRGNWSWNGPDNTFFLTSNGETNRIKANETRGNWCYVGGRVGGQMAGVAVLGHPSNFRAPQPMRVHPREPFLCLAPSQLGDWSIEPGKPFVSQYRFVVMDGEPRKELIDQLWDAYAHPPRASVGPVSSP